MYPSPIRAQVYQMDDPYYDIGGGVSQIGIMVIDPMCGISRSYTSGVIPTIKWCPSKIQDSSLNHLPQMQTFASMRSTPFMKIDDKGGEIVQRYESFGRDWYK